MIREPKKVREEILNPPFKIVRNKKKSSPSWLKMAESSRNFKSAIDKVQGNKPSDN